MADPMADQNCFKFEQDFVEGLRCIPMRVRFKLDTCGVKLKLNHWNQFSYEERQTLLEMPCESAQTATAYREYLQTLVVHYARTPASTLPIDPLPAWQDPTQVPVQVTAQATQHQLKITPAQWASLTALKRFALIKLSQPGHENRNFLPAMAEFGLA
ncbi:MAG: nitrate reductase associated protein [Cyanobacteria bacterium P01_D01_bin.44]